MVLLLICCCCCYCCCCWWYGDDDYDHQIAKYEQLHSSDLHSKHSTSTFHCNFRPWRDNNNWYAQIKTNWYCHHATFEISHSNVVRETSTFKFFTKSVNVPVTLYTLHSLKVPCPRFGLYIQSCEVVSQSNENHEKAKLLVLPFPQTCIINYTEPHEFSKQSSAPRNNIYYII